MHVTDGASDLRRVVTRPASNLTTSLLVLDLKQRHRVSPLFRESSFALEMKEQLAAVDVIKDEIQFIDSLKAVMQPDEERVLEVLQQNVPLSHDVLLLQNKKKTVKC